MAQLIPLTALPAQTFQIQLNGQACAISVQQKRTGIFVNLYVSNILIIGGIIAENLNRIVRSIYLGFQGDLVFADTQGDSDPVYTGLGSRYVLIYLSPDDLGGLG